MSKFVQSLVCETVLCLFPDLLGLWRNMNIYINRFKAMTTSYLILWITSICKAPPSGVGCQKKNIHTSSHSTPKFDSSSRAIYIFTSMIMLVWYVAGVSRQLFNWKTSCYDRCLIYLKIFEDLTESLPAALTLFYSHSDIHKTSR